MPQPKTKTGRLSEVARHVVVPSGVTTTGWPAVRDTCAGFGVSFDDWQDGAGRLILAKRSDGSYAASIGGVVMSIPRQVGKTFLIGAIVFALCLLHPGLTVLWTAHRLRTANETFGKMQSFARRRKVKPHVAKVVLGSGDEAIMFHNGSRILFGARERGFGRGFDDVDVEVFDEAQILTENAVDDMIPAMNTAANPLPIYIGTPPKPADPSEIFTLKRNQALSGEDEDTAYVEFSADPDADPEDRKQWRKANPSYPTRTNDTSMLRMKKNLTAESFLREGMGVWDDTDVTLWLAVPKKTWTDRASKEEPDQAVQAGWLEGVVDIAIELDPERSTTSIVAAGSCREGGIGFDVIAQGPGTAWVVDHVLGLQGIGRVVIDKGGPAASLITPLTDAGVEVTECTTAELAKATGAMLDDLAEGAAVHRDSPELTDSVASAVLRKYGESRLIDRLAGQPAAFIAAILARWGHKQAPDPEPYAAVVYS